MGAQRHETGVLQLPGNRDGQRWKPQASEVLTTVNPDGSSPTPVADLASCGGPTGTNWPLASFGQGRAVRYQGPLRTDTAVAVAASPWSSAPAVVIARDDTYPDALAPCGRCR